MKGVTNMTAAHLTTYVKPTYPHNNLPVLTDMDVPSTMLMQVLHKALTMRRAGGSQTEARFVAWLCNRLPVSMIDEAGNIHVDMRTHPCNRTMFTSHTDTVHHSGGANTVRIERSEGKILWRAGEGACLGADDGAGVAIMVHMIDRGVPGYYVFFRGEESGGVGSTWLAKEMPSLLADIDRCVSFDRADYHDVITHQAGGRCCSDEFASALAAALTTDDMSLAFLPDATGVFTDSANLTHLIPECTNLSVGYKHQHGDGEWQDVTFLSLLASQLVQVQWDDLPTKRNPKVVESKYGHRTEYASYADWATEYTGKTLPTNTKTADDEFAEYVVDALYEAYDEDYALIRGIVTEWLSPEEPDTARKHIDPRRVSAEKYDHFARAIFSGRMHASEVLDDLTVLMYKE